MYYNDLIERPGAEISGINYFWTIKSRKGYNIEIKPVYNISGLSLLLLKKRV